MYYIITATINKDNPALFSQSKIVRYQMNDVMEDIDNYSAIGCEIKVEDSEGNLHYLESES